MYYLMPSTRQTGVQTSIARIAYAVHPVTNFQGGCNWWMQHTNPKEIERDTNFRSTKSSVELLCGNSSIDGEGPLLAELGRSGPDIPALTAGSIRQDDSQFNTGPPS
jgi:hypothetical protein